MKNTNAQQFLLKQTPVTVLPIKHIKLIFKLYHNGILSNQGQSSQKSWRSCSSVSCLTGPWQAKGRDWWGRTDLAKQLLISMPLWAQPDDHLGSVQLWKRQSRSTYLWLLYCDENNREGRVGAEHMKEPSSLCFPSESLVFSSDNGGWVICDFPWESQIWAKNEFQRFIIKQLTTDRETLTTENLRTKRNGHQR